ncbi:MAG: FAD-binding protein [Microscillaceae bacterium]|nr:FAD-binding protein [Microscillaceae bacterium]
MKLELNLELSPEVGLDETALRSYILQKISKEENPDVFIRKIRRSIDARSRDIKVNLQVEVYLGETPPPLLQFKKNYPNVSQRPVAVIVGAGPAGIFAALRLIELGIKPIVLERGKDVKSRRRDLANIQKKQTVNENSNYCFGEGGAGTYSDGKLYTRSKKRGDIRRVLEILVANGAVEDILVDAHPHIGTNKLPKIVEALRESILKAGGEIHFEKKVTDFILQNGEMKGVVCADGEEIQGIGVILATGHSARDIFELLYAKQIYIEFKPFALGVRIEHAQALIDQIQYKKTDRGVFLPPSPYALVTQVRYKGVERGVFSFCMCPGGFIVPAATSPGEVVVNGMSPSRRNSHFANSGMVVTVGEAEIQAYKQFGALAGLEFQKAVEQKACQLAGNLQIAPAQRMLDFTKGKISSSLPDCSYQPGLLSVDLKEVLPDFISQSLKSAFPVFGQKMKGYFTNEAQLIGVESRTSSPVRIPRDKESYEHLQIKRLFPCGEGAGYAGGIMSAAMDGERCAEKLVEKYA